MATTSTTKKRGGRYVSSGSYACTFSPPIQCRDSHPQTLLTSNFGLIGKVFKDDESGLDELEISKIVKSIDPRSEFTVPLVRRCRIGKPAPSDNPGSCDKALIPNKSIQLVYEHGGKDLWNFAAKGVSGEEAFLKMFLKFEPVFRGMQRLNDANWLHLDLKPENIVYNGKKVSVVDFGMMARVADLYDKVHRPLLMYDYPYYPPEFKLYVMSKTFNRDADFNKFKSFFDRNFSVINVMDEPTATKQLARFVKMYNPNDFDSMFKKSDIYAMGMTLMVVLRSAVEKDTPLTFIASTLIRDMMNCNPYERPDWGEVLRRFEGLKGFLSGKKLSKVVNSKRKDALSFKTR